MAIKEQGVALTPCLRRCTLVYMHSKLYDTRGKALSHLSLPLFEMPKSDDGIKNAQPGARPHFLPMPDPSLFS